MRLPPPLAALAATLILAAPPPPAAAQNPTPVPAPAAPAPAPARPESAAVPAPAPADTGAAPADSASPRLAIRPGDVIRLEVWDHKEMSGEFPVDENYDVVFPLIGPVNVRHISVAQLRDRLNTDLGQLFQRPFFTLTPLFRVAVLGQVMRPGLYSADPTLTIVDLVAMAGGPTSQANQNGMQLIRNGQRIRIPLDPATLARSTLQELGVRSGDQLVMPRAFLTREDLGLIVNIANFLLLAYTVLRK